MRRELLSALLWPHRQRRVANVAADVLLLMKITPLGQMERREGRNTLRSPPLVWKQNSNLGTTILADMPNACMC